MEDGDLRHHDDGRAVGHCLGEQQTKVCLVVDGSECIVDSSGHNCIDTGKYCVEEHHHNPITNLGSNCFLSCNNKMIKKGTNEVFEFHCLLPKKGRSGKHEVMMVTTNPMNKRQVLNPNLSYENPQKILQLPLNMF